MTTLPVRLDYGMAMADGVGPRGGLDAAELHAERERVERGVARVAEEGRAGRLGFIGLPHAAATLDAIDAKVATLPPEVDEVVVLGIGGSSLGTRAIDVALRKPRPDRAPGERRIHLPDNADPWFLAGLLDGLDPKRTLALVVSKSGSTVETAAQYLVVRAWLEKALGAQATRHLVFVTDPEKGPLREIARRDDIVTFDVPAAVGGRFSVLSAVGLLPARLAGLDARGLLAGAGALAEACMRPSLESNPAAALAAVHVLHHRLRGHDIHVLMPYADALRPFASWYVQLWAESLGKRTARDGRRVESGPTPLAAVGATDQHAQVQLFVEGPRDKLVTFVQVARPASDLQIPKVDGPFAYLGGHGLLALLDAERRGTELALARDGRPSITLSVDRLDAPTLGALFYLYEAATAFAGELYDVDAFDQPGVEEGKRLAFGLLGRAGFESAADDVRGMESSRPTRFRVG